MWKFLVSPVGLALVSLPAGAQSVNIDLGPASSPFGSPPPSYGASAQSPGVWNRVGATSAASLKKWDGAPTNVSLSISGVQPGCPALFWAVDQAGTSGEDEALLDDGHSCSETGCDYTFQGLAPGDYTVDTIVMRGSPSCLQGRLRVSVQGSPDLPQYVGGSWSGAYVQGDTSPSAFSYTANFARHTLTVSNGTLRITVQLADTIIDFVEAVGIQLDEHDQGFIGTFHCYGDGTGSACPCGNSGDPGFGCQNSAGTRGAFLYASGTTSPDTAVLHVSGELPSSLTIFLQGTATIGPVTYGDGLRCAGGILKRLYAKSASAGSVSAPVSGDPSITARSAALGDPIAPGERRHYQTYYRDANASFCPNPPGSTFNTSNAVKIVW